MTLNEVLKCEHQQPASRNIHLPRKFIRLGKESLIQRNRNFYLLHRYTPSFEYNDLAYLGHYLHPGSITFQTQRATLTGRPLCFYLDIYYRYLDYFCVSLCTHSTM